MMLGPFESEDILERVSVHVFSRSKISHEFTRFYQICYCYTLGERILSIILDDNYAVVVSEDFG